MAGDRTRRIGRDRRAGGFTLVEILVVVTILGILAAILIPQFARAGAEAIKSALARDLQAVHQQIELYRVNNVGMLPTGDPVQPMGAPAGWGVMVSAQYLREAPFNSYTGGSVLGVSAGRAATVSHPKGYGVGWEYLVTGDRLDLWASGYDEIANRLSDE